MRGAVLSSRLSRALLLPLIENAQSLLGSLDAAERHGTKGWSHPVSAIHLTELHASDDQSWNNLPRALHDRILGGIHVQAAHASELLELLHRDEALDTEGTKWPVVAGRGDDDRGVDGVWIHA